MAAYKENVGKMVGERKFSDHGCDDGSAEFAKG